MYLDESLSVVEIVWVEAGLRCEVYSVPDKSSKQDFIKVSMTAFCWRRRSL